jgi:hypothetical protein
MKPFRSESRTILLQVTMNSRKPHLYSLLGALLFVSCVAGERHTTHIARSWPASGIRRIEVREVDGAISVVAADPNTISLEANVQAWSQRPDPKKDNQGYFVTTLEGDTLVIGRREKRHGGFSFFKFDKLTVDYELRVPPQVALDLNTVNGHVETHGVAGETEVTTVNGGISIDTPGSSELTAHTVNGRIETRFASDFRGASLKTVNGRVTAILPASASFVGDFSQVNGDFEAAFPLNIHSHPGSRRVSGEVNGGQHELKIVTVNGDIKIDNGSGIVPPAPPAPPTPPTAPTPPPGAPAPPTPPAPPDPPNL